MRVLCSTLLLLAACAGTTSSPTLEQVSLARRPAPRVVVAQPSGAHRGASLYRRDR